jgi:hypothetical protein
MRGLLGRCERSACTSASANALNAFLHKARRRGLSNTNAMRKMIRSWAGEPDEAEPAPRVLRDGGSAVDAVSLDRSG